MERTNRLKMGKLGEQQLSDNGTFQLNTSEWL